MLHGTFHWVIWNPSLFLKSQNEIPLHYYDSKSVLLLTKAIESGIVLK